MNFVRKVANSNILASIIDIPENLKNRKVEILIFPYENEHVEASVGEKPKRARGLLERYKNKELQALESGAWARATVDKYENS
ncbi:MAG: hypothetical protein PHS52_01740 [Desulfotomaculaceae bacterium]|nr:hypothetical protein [Desulfotomaculaceae bacterium]